VVIGGIMNGVTAVQRGTNDFYAVFAGPTLDGASPSYGVASTSASSTSFENFGSPSSGQIVGNVVPEPSSLAMCVLAGLTGFAGAFARLNR
jgi:hypothetical protein